MNDVNKSQKCRFGRELWRDPKSERLSEEYINGSHLYKFCDARQMYCPFNFEEEKCPVLEEILKDND